MESMQRILCPVDFSESSTIALNYAAKFGAGVGAELILLHAFDRPATLDMEGQSNPADTTLHEQLENVRPDTENVQVTRVLHAGSTGEVICWLAEDRACDLIIMGTHGHTGLKHLLLGSTAEYVLRHARCPVLTIRLRPENEPPLKEPTVLPLTPPRLM